MRKPAKYYSLKTFPYRIRQSWHKYNLYALKYGSGRWDFGGKTQFQQQWIAKSKTRAYHAEHVTEKQWIRLFSKRLLSAVDMPATYLAKHDGSEQASGRGSGLATLKISADKFSRLPTSSASRDNKFNNKKLSLKRMTGQMMEAPLARMTPYMQMIFAPLERRLDTALFRAMFASSVRQARQFCIHGAVTVNGKKMVHPSYLLNPGDMFQVNVERVLFATGQQRAHNDKLQSRTKKRLESNKGLLRRFLKTKGEPSAHVEASAEATSEEAPETEEAKAQAETGVEAEAAEETSSKVEVSDSSESPSARFNAREQIFKKGLGYIRRMLQNRSDPEDISADDSAHIRAFRDIVREGAGYSRGTRLTSTEIVEELENHSKRDADREQYRWVTVTSDMRSQAPSSTQPATGAAEESTPTNDADAASVEASSATTQSSTPQTSSSSSSDSKVIWRGFVKDIPEEYKDLLETQWDLQAVNVVGAEAKYLGQLLRADDENPYDETKPYATPWLPRRYMAPFAFIPRYLEVNQNICAAVYLRHPVARKGYAEVPTPFSYWHGQLAHNWYVRRG